MNKKPTFEKFSIINFDFNSDSTVKILLCHTTKNKNCYVIFPFYKQRKEIIVEFLKDSVENKFLWTLNFIYKFLNFEV